MCAYVQMCGNIDTQRLSYCTQFHDNIIVVFTNMLSYPPPSLLSSLEFLPDLNSLELSLSQPFLSEFSSSSSNAGLAALDQNITTRSYETTHLKQPTSNPTTTTQPTTTNSNNQNSNDGCSLLSLSSSV